MLEAYLHDLAPPVERQTPEQLVGALQVIEWLDDILEGLPDRDDVRRRIERNNLLRPFCYLAEITNR
jgi:hypothetical protein